MTNPIQIPLKKIRMLGYLAGALVFVLLSSWMLQLTTQANQWSVSRLMIIVIGVAGCLFFGLMVLLMLAKCISSKPGLILNEEGLYDNSSGLSVGFVAWYDVKKIKIWHNGSTTFLVVVVNRPSQYIKREKQLLKRIAMRINQRITGSPINILVNFLDMNLYDLQDIIAAKMKQSTANEGRKP
ncbi:MAG: hypothetical protein IT252_15750 [Chitinophagaceae bacterium]|nr:hypothetical protein [Chitinophagaceae bacterium]